LEPEARLVLLPPLAALSRQVLRLASRLVVTRNCCLLLLPEAMYQYHNHPQRAQSMEQFLLSEVRHSLEDPHL
jgi:hypothetical protein